ncbi:Indolepyruvate ferredoxin oxidoreductase [Flexistipes sinusarabici DSM 4947]|uniref:Indolepyruvate ferredoxin oxidoreductase n=1 Tax=Flexistipes sinusarabici (strain ATCC 49648 / DSM 4947 / MAS 10) TaxID=717231 RepID=F8E677_FLESM|nr:indolepyruvate oxidoreductase subunit beta [Flexistipes sinusarabici]AEI14785.1 Indolepyruvate ferredoxin oxidoreductase [Flexistipes sinusarabici DSM 4947]
MKFDILMVGVGGQGTVLASDIVCDVALSAGYDVKKSEIHGMAQRGGSVVSHVRIGEKIASPVIPVGSVDILVSFERMEFLRYLEYINKNTSLVLNTGMIHPPGTAGGEEEYPEDYVEDNIKKFNNSYMIDAFELAEQALNRKVTSTVVLGKLATLLPFRKKAWEEVISDKVPPKTVEYNLKAFDLGFNA